MVLLAEKLAIPGSHKASEYFIRPLIDNESLSAETA